VFCGQKDIFIHYKLGRDCWKMSRGRCKFLSRPTPPYFEAWNVQLALQTMLGFLNASVRLEIVIVNEPPENRRFAKQFGSGQFAPLATRRFRQFEATRSAQRSRHLPGLPALLRSRRRTSTFAYVRRFRAIAPTNRLPVRSMNLQVALCVSALCSVAPDPVEYDESASPILTGLTYNYASNVSYSVDGVDFTYSPVPDGEGTFK